MRIGVQAWGSEGDMRPFFSLSKGLSDAGHQVTLAASDITGTDYSELLDTYDISLKEVGKSFCDPKRFQEIGYEVARRAHDPITQIFLIIKYLFEPIERDMLAAAHELCKQNDLVVGHFLVYPLAIAAQKANKPRVSVFTAPMPPTAHYPPAGMPDFGRISNKLLWNMGKSLLTLRFGKKIRRMYVQENVQAPGDILFKTWGSPLLNLIAVSPSIFPKPPDWDPEVHVSGFLNMAKRANTRHSAWHMPNSLKAFLGDGPKPVYITFGSMMKGEAEPNDIMQILLDAVRLSGCRAIIQADWSTTYAEPSEPNIYCITRAPHENVFPHCAAVVHHGGAGTTQTATQFGCPSIPVMYVVDQFFWGNLLYKAGLAPKPLKRVKLTAKKLSRAITQVLGSNNMQEKAKTIGAQMRNEDGVQTAVKLIEQIL